MKLLVAQIIKILISLNAQVQADDEPVLFKELKNVTEKLRKREIRYEALFLLYLALTKKNKNYMNKYRHDKKKLIKIFSDDFEFDCQLFDAILKAKLSDENKKLIFSAKELQGEKSDVSFYNKVCVIFESENKLKFFEKNFKATVIWFNQLKKLKFTQEQEELIDPIYLLEENGIFDSKESIKLIYKALKEHESLSEEQEDFYLKKTLAVYKIKASKLTPAGSLAKYLAVYKAKAKASELISVDSDVKKTIKSTKVKTKHEKRKREDFSEEEIFENSDSELSEEKKIEKRNHDDFFKSKPKKSALKKNVTSVTSLSNEPPLKKVKYKKRSQPSKGKNHVS